MRLTMKRAAGALVPVGALLSVIAVSGCGASSVSGVFDPVAKAATVSNDAGGYTMSFKLSTSSAALPGGLTGTGTGSYDTASKTGTAEVDMNLGSQSELKALLGSSTLDMQEIISGHTFYLKFPPALSDKLPGHKPWISFDLAQLASDEGMSGLGALIDNPTQSNPGALLQYLKAVSGKVTRVGTGPTVAGHATTEYRASVDLDRYPQIVPAAQRAQARQGVAELQKISGISTIPVTVDVDSGHLVRQLQMAFTQHVAGQSLSTDMTLDITGYGPQPAPAIPATGQVLDGASLLQMATKSGSVA